MGTQTDTELPVENEEAGEDTSLPLVAQHSLLLDSVKALRLPQLLGCLDELLVMLGDAASTPTFVSAGVLSTACALAADLRPLLSWLLRLAACLVTRAVHTHKASCKLEYVLLRIFRTLFERCASALHALLTTPSSYIAS